MLYFIILMLVAIKLYNKYQCGWCYSRAIMTGKVVVVTGANAGIGYETAFNLARRGAKVILACRDIQKGKAAAEDITKKTGNKHVLYKNLDLASLDSVRRFAEDLNSSEAKLDVLINNAGGIGYGDEKTSDGILREMQTNHFGPFLLTLLLVPLLKASDSGRIILVSSLAHKFGTIDFKTINRELKRHSYLGVFKIYSCSKLCNVLFSNELSRRLEGTRITVNSLHPGHIRTSIYKNIDNFGETVMNFLLSAFFKNALEGAQTTIYLAVSDDVLDVTGKYFVDCKESTMSKSAMDKELAGELWRYSEELVRLKPEEVSGLIRT